MGNAPIFKTSENIEKYPTTVYGVALKQGKENSAEWICLRCVQAVLKAGIAPRAPLSVRSELLLRGMGLSSVELNAYSSGVLEQHEIEFERSQRP